MAKELRNPQKKRIENVITAHERFNIPGEPSSLGHALFHCVSLSDPIRDQPHCPKTKLGLSVLVRNLSHTKLIALPWGTIVDVVMTSGGTDD